MSEDRQDQATHTTEFIDRIGAADVLKDTSSRREFLLSLDYQAFRDWLIRLNGLARGNAINNRGIDGENVYVMTMLPPDPEDKEPLLNETLESVKRVLSDSEHEAEALETASLILSGAINFIHPFNDGNGRTSRLIGYLIRDGYDGSEETKTRLASVLGDEGNTAFYNNPGTINGWLTGRTLTQNAPGGDTKWPVRLMVDGPFGESFTDSDLSQLSEESRKKVNRLSSDPAFGGYAATKVMLERGLLPEGVSFNNGDFAYADKKDYFAKFNDEDVEAFTKESRKMRMDRILIFLKAMESPDSFKIKLDENSDGIEFTDRIVTLRDYYNEFIENFSKIYGKENPYDRRRQRLAGAAVLKTGAST